MIQALVLVAAMSGGPTLVAQSKRCNSIVSDQLEGQLRSDEAHPPTAGQAVARINDLADIVNNVSEENGILTSVCPEADLPPRLQDLHGVAAQAFMLQSDASLVEFASCPDQKNAIASGFLAQAWVELAHGSPADGPPPPPSVTKTVPKVSQRAAAIGLKLPVFADTSDYWTQQVQDLGKKAVAACASK